MNDHRLNVRYDENTVCEQTSVDCNCGKVFHFDNKPNKCYFYKKKKEQNKSDKNKTKNAKRSNKQNGGYFGSPVKKPAVDALMRVGNRVIEKFDLGEKEYEIHLKIALSIIESNKNRIKSNYLNYIDAR